MTRQDAADRRASRLAFLLAGGDPFLTARILAATLALAPRLDRIDPARLDRVCITAARRVLRRHRPAPASNTPRPELAVLHATHAMPEQCREAWLLARLDQLNSVVVARAMDSSRTAAARHLERADSEMAPVLAMMYPKGADAVAAVRTALDSIDFLPPLRQARDRHRRRSRLRLAIVLLASLSLTAIAATALYWLANA
ncbi:MAG: hypothetical protein KF745_04920 [Phycisphaeraceae bacterium]|nr:hypothetical protein [Phycisphaeraceae bacterium]